MKKNRGIRVYEKNDHREKICNIEYRSNFTQFQKEMLNSFIHQILIKINYQRDIMVYLNDKKFVVFATFSNVKINELYFREIISSIEHLND